MVKEKIGNEPERLNKYYVGMQEEEENDFGNRWKSYANELKFN